MKRVLHISAKALKIVFVTIFLLIVSIAIFLNSSIFDSIARKQIQSRLGKAMQREVHLESFAFNPFLFNFRLKNFEIGNDPRSPEVPFFRAKEIYARISWKNLF